MRKVTRRATYYLLLISVIILISSVVYDFAMKAFEPGQYPPEGTGLSILHSMQVVVETFTATGYGSDSPWRSPELNVLVMILDLTGVALFFLALPAVFVPLFQEALSREPPTSPGEGISDHIVICTYSSRADALIEELQAHDVEYVLVEPDENRATDLDAEGYTVVHADPESVSELGRIALSDARALVADVSDQIDASIVLSAREIDENVRIVSVVEDTDVEPYHRLAGADTVLAPRQLLGRGLARKVTTTVQTELGDEIRVGEDFDIAEIPVQRGSDLTGTTLAGSRIGEQYGVDVIGVWSRGEFETAPSPDTSLDAGTVLLATGSEDQLSALRLDTRAPVRPFTRGETVVVGYGAVGQAVATALDAADIPHTIVDQREMEAVDVVGDATDPDVLRRAGVPDAQSVVLTLPDDTATEFATLIIRELADSPMISARAETPNAVQKAYRAGADYVLSLASITGRSVAAEVLDDEDVLSTDTQVEIIRLVAPALVGETLAGAQVRERTGCTVVAVERDGEILTDLDPDFRIRRGDELVIAGTDEGTNRFVDLFG